MEADGTSRIHVAALGAGFALGAEAAYLGHQRGKWLEVMRSFGDLPSAFHDACVYAPWPWIVCSLGVAMVAKQLALPARTGNRLMAQVSCVLLIGGACAFLFFFGVLGSLGAVMSDLKNPR